MTGELASAARRLIAIEKDTRLVEALRNLARQQPKIEVVAGDVLELDLGRLAGDERFQVYGNLPYYITSPILHRLFRYADRIGSIHIVIQLEVAARLVAHPGRRDYAYLSALVQFYSQPEIVFRIPPHAFRPRPKVTSALARLRVSSTAGALGERARLGIVDERRFLEFVRACFAQKRKTLLNNLRALFPAKQAEAILREAGLNPKVRAEQLRLGEFAALFRQIPSE